MSLSPDVPAMRCCGNGLRNFPLRTSDIIKFSELVRKMSRGAGNPSSEK